MAVMIWPLRINVLINLIAPHFDFARRLFTRSFGEFERFNDNRQLTFFAHVVETVHVRTLRGRYHDNGGAFSSRRSGKQDPSTPGVDLVRVTSEAKLVAVVRAEMSFPFRNFLVLG